MKRLFVLLSIILMLFALPESAYATSACETHMYIYNDKKETDICAVCGYTRIHKSKHVQFFVTRGDWVVPRNEPRESGDAGSGYSKWTPIRVVGRVRNEVGDLWLQLDDGSFIFADDAAFDFDSTAELASDAIVLLTVGEEMCVEYAHTLKNFDFYKACYYTNPTFYTAMAIVFARGGDFDLKIDELLGLNTYDYYVFTHGYTPENRYTGEELGNILYGYICQQNGISAKKAVWFGGVEGDKKGNIVDAAACFFLGDESRCDDKNDIIAIYIGSYYSEYRSWEKAEKMAVGSDEVSEWCYTTQDSGEVILDAILQAMD